MIKRSLLAGLVALVLAACSQSPELGPEAELIPGAFPNEDLGLISPEGQVIIDAVAEGRLSTSFRPDAVSLDEEPLSVQACSRPTLRQGSRGSSVTYLQNRLLAFGGAPASHIRGSGGADGIFGPGTDKAVRAFQTHFNITVDGIVGPQSWSKVGCSASAGNRTWTRHTHGRSMSHFLSDRSNRTPLNANWTTDICSNSPDTGLSFDFRNPCIRHDFGYRNYKKYGFFTETNRKNIDDTFLADMKAHCATRSFLLRADCYATAYLYYAAVRSFGG